MVQLVKGLLYKCKDLISIPGIHVLKPSNLNHSYRKIGMGTGETPQKLREESLAHIVLNTDPASNKVLVLCLTSTHMSWHTYIHTVIHSYTHIHSLIQGKLIKWNNKDKMAPEVLHTWGVLSKLLAFALSAFVELVFLSSQASQQKVSRCGS